LDTKTRTKLALFRLIFCSYPKNSYDHLTVEIEAEKSTSAAVGVKSKVAK